MPLGNPAGYFNQARGAQQRRPGGVPQQGGIRQRAPGVGQGFNQGGFGGGDGMPTLPTRPGGPPIPEPGGMKTMPVPGGGYQPPTGGTKMPPVGDAGIPPPASLPGLPEGVTPRQPGVPDPSMDQLMGHTTVGRGGNQPTNIQSFFSKGYQPSGTGTFNSGGFNNQLNDIIANGGLFDDSSFGRRVGDARAGIERTRAGEQDTLSAQLAERGLLGSGAEAEALTRHSADMEGQNVLAFNDIFKDESQRASDRLMQALGIGAGLETSGADRAVQRELGLGNIGVGHERNSIDYLLGTGRLDLDRNRLNADIEKMDLDGLVRMLEQMGGGADRATRGFIGRNN